MGERLYVRFVLPAQRAMFRRDGSQCVCVCVCVCLCVCVCCVRVVAVWDGWNDDADILYGGLLRSIGLGKRRISLKRREGGGRDGRGGGREEGYFWAGERRYKAPSCQNKVTRQRSFLTIEIMSRAQKQFQEGRPPFLFLNRHFGSAVLFSWIMQAELGIQSVRFCSVIGSSVKKILLGQNDAKQDI